MNSCLSETLSESERSVGVLELGVEEYCRAVEVRVSGCLNWDSRTCRAVELLHRYARRFVGDQAQLCVHAG